MSNSGMASFGLIPKKCRLLEIHNIYIYIEDSAWCKRAR
jgi:hypothetical protein